MNNQDQDITLRPCCPSDQELLFAIYAGTRREEVEAWGWNTAQQDAFLRMQHHAQQQGYVSTYPEADHQIVCLSGEPIGRILVQRNPDAVLLVDIALLAEYRGKGIGSRLLSRLIQQSTGTRLPVRLQVHKTNVRAQRLYERLGFVLKHDGQMYCQMEKTPE